MHDGIAQMFEVIEYARMMVGTKAIGTLSTGYLTALGYARERVQGADLARMADKTAPRVTILAHPDVRRMLMLQKAYAEGLRAVYLYTATFQDHIRAGQAAGTDVSLAGCVNDLLLPIVKGVGSERASELLSLSLQTLGGSRATCRTTPSSSTSATPGSTRSTRGRRRSSRWTSCSARSSGTAVGR